MENNQKERILLLQIYAAREKHTLRETFGGKIMQMVRWHGTYFEENIFARISTQKGDILIENRRGDNLIARIIFV